MHPRRFVLLDASAGALIASQLIFCPESHIANMSSDNTTYWKLGNVDSPQRRPQRLRVSPKLPLADRAPGGAPHVVIPWQSAFSKESTAGRHVPQRADGERVASHQSLKRSRR